MKTIEYLQEQIKNYKKEIQELKEKGYSVSAIEKVENKINVCEELIENYEV